MADRPDARPSSARGAKRLALALGSLAVSLLLAEGLLRLFWTNPYRDEVPNHVVPLAIHHPGKALPVDLGALDPEHPVGLLETDARGYLLPAHRFEDPDAIVLFLGGSTTECSAVRAEERFPAVVSRALERSGLRVDVLNAGKSGNTTHDAVNVLLNWSVEDRPTVAVLMEAANDIGVLREDGSYRSRAGRPLGAGIAATWLFQTASSASSVVGALRNWATVSAPRARDAETPPPAQPEPLATEPYASRLRAFIGLCRAFGIRPVLMTQPLTHVRTELTPEWTSFDDQERFNEVVRRVAAEQDVVLIDLVRHLAQDIEGWEEPMKIFYDGIHVTQAGSRIYGEYIAARLRETVFAPPAAPGR